MEFSPRLCLPLPQKLRIVSPPPGLSGPHALGHGHFEPSVTAVVAVGSFLSLKSLRIQGEESEPSRPLGKRGICSSSLAQGSDFLRLQAHLALILGI